MIERVHSLKRTWDWEWTYPLWQAFDNSLRFPWENKCLVCVYCERQWKDDDHGVCSKYAGECPWFITNSWQNMRRKLLIHMYRILSMQFSHEIATSHDTWSTVNEHPPARLHHFSFFPENDIRLSPRLFTGAWQNDGKLLPCIFVGAVLTTDHLPRCTMFGALTNWSHIYCRVTRICT